TLFRSFPPVGFLVELAILVKRGHHRWENASKPPDSSHPPSPLLSKVSELLDLSSLTRALVVHHGTVVGCLPSRPDTPRTRFPTTSPACRGPPGPFATALLPKA